MMFYDWCECVRSVLGATKHSSAIVLTLGNKDVFDNTLCEWNVTKRNSCVQLNITAD